MAEEFTCIECGRHIISVGYNPPGGNQRCAACIHMPGWYSDSELQRRIDPDYKTMEPFKRCPKCESTFFYKGPRGGAAMNVICVDCHEGYNLLIYPGAPILLINELGHQDWRPGDILNTEKPT